ncbi:MAG: shikimate kinase [Gemmataceae bacterium]|nr:shikimate kinase [Gemmataceae bacterium]MDW8266908.1 shikimate kinase [Gemmataceae bacterium]
MTAASETEPRPSGDCVPADRSSGGVLPSVVFLVGYRGTGKSTVARHLARRLGWGWVDADAVLEERFGRSIRQIFADEGEAGFRAKEAAVLHDLVALSRHVVATGGGVVLRSENRELLRRGWVVWLTADPDTIERRLSGDAATAERRPNLTVGGRAEIETLLRLREPLYREVAHLTVDTVGRPPDEIAEAILREMKRFA